MVLKRIMLAALAAIALGVCVIGVVWLRSGETRSDGPVGPRGLPTRTYASQQPGAEPAPAVDP